MITLTLGVTWTCCLGCVIAAHPCCLQLKRLSAAVGFGGGRSQLLEEGSLPRELLESPHNCVIDVTAGSSQALLPSSTTEWAKSVKNIVQRFAQTSCFYLNKRRRLCFLRIYSPAWWFSTWYLHTEKASESSQSLKLVWLRYMHHVISTVIPPVEHQTQVVNLPQLFCFYFCFSPHCVNMVYSFLSVYGSEPIPKVNPRISNASLSQGAAVDETVLPAASQNITAYAVNTEPSQGYQPAHTATCCLHDKSYSLHSS